MQSGMWMLGAAVNCGQARRAHSCCLLPVGGDLICAILISGTDGADLHAQ